MSGRVGASVHTTADSFPRSGARLCVARWMADNLVCVWYSETSGPWPTGRFGAPGKAEQVSASHSGKRPRVGLLFSIRDGWYCGRSIRATHYGVGGIIFSRSGAHTLCLRPLGWLLRLIWYSAPLYGPLTSRRSPRCASAPRPAKER
jgi:hypothetical protein